MISPLILHAFRGAFFVLTKSYNADLVEDEEEHVKPVNGEERIALPLFKAALDEGGDHCHGAGGNTNGEVEHEIDALNGQGATVDDGAQGQNERGVDDVGTDDVAH